MLSAHPSPAPAPATRLDHLDATRAFALVLGVVFHASLSFVPVFMGWAVQDVSTGPLVSLLTTVAHSFRLELFFLLAGLFSRGMLDRHGLAGFIRSRLLRIGVPFIVGWFLLRPLLVSGWIMGATSLRGDVDILAGLLGGIRSLESLPTGMFQGSHLWFLYYLLLVTAVTLLGRALLAKSCSCGDAARRGSDNLVSWLNRSPWAPGLLALPTAALLWFMRGWGMDTPDQSLAPHLPALGVYGGFFALGWIIGRHRDRIGQIFRPNWQRTVLAAAGITTVLTLDDIGRNPGHPQFVAAHVGHCLGYAVMMWSLVFLTPGLFGKLCQRPNALVRYVADASYWIYLVHLPIVVWLQVAVAEWPLHWSFKLLLVTTTTMALALVTYDLFVRPTWLGWLLTGQRRARVLLSKRPRN
jgi:peptidoglycan/LPS O-acetylase OafA/YrhL